MAASYAAQGIEAPNLLDIMDKIHNAADEVTKNKHLTELLEYYKKKVKNFQDYNGAMDLAKTLAFLARLKPELADMVIALVQDAVASKKRALETIKAISDGADLDDYFSPDRFDK